MALSGCLVLVSADARWLFPFVRNCRMRPFLQLLSMDMTKWHAEGEPIKFHATPPPPASLDWAAYK